MVKVNDEVKEPPQLLARRPDSCRKTRGQAKQEQLEPEDVFKCFYLLIKKIGAVTMSLTAIKKVPDLEMMNITFDKENGTYTFVVPKKRKRGIVKPSKRIIQP